ncbi:glutathione S-transferase family protein [Aliamphritea spongicola]|uniref:glutathione S-transferase family protein n=1 Tax=Aliamphritea spongicola TaxID=707589 RepID=UPI00196AA21F|nr:glutathione S-transferase family protein [Aliamphritea spongicola]MBN3564377.1 glutathione S-transferase family protein [Aliamphritea spongicola]
MITLYHLENSRSIRILWLLEEMGLEYELLHFQREQENSMAEARFKQLHVLGKAPLLSDGERMIAESGAIIEYLLDTYGDRGLRPEAGTDARIGYNYWLHAAEGSIMNVNTMELLLNRFDQRAPWLFKPVIRLMTSKARATYTGPVTRLLLQSMETTLEQQAWFAGDDFSAADIQMGYTVRALQARGGLGRDYPACQRWIMQMEARPAYKSAMEKNGDFQLLKD